MRRQILRRHRPSGRRRMWRGRWSRSSCNLCRPNTNGLPTLVLQSESGMVEWKLNEHKFHNLRQHNSIHFFILVRPTCVSVPLIHTQLRAHIHTQIHTPKQARIHTHIHTNTYSHTHIYIYIYIYIVWNKNSANLFCVMTSKILHGFEWNLTCKKISWQD